MILYKYYSPTSNSFKSISNRGLYCNHSETMNDPFECLASVKRSYNSSQIQIFREYIEASNEEWILNLSKRTDKELSEFLNDYRIRSINRYAFCSLTETPDNILMWSHYSNAHKGFVIGIEFEDELLNSNHHFQKVNYSDELKAFDIDIYSRLLVGEGGDELMNYIFKDYSIKAKCWEYENEWRIWRKKPEYWYYNKQDVKEVYFGVKTENYVKEIVMKLTDFLGSNFLYKEMEQKANPIRLAP